MLLMEKLHLLGIQLQIYSWHLPACLKGRSDFKGNSKFSEEHFSHECPFASSIETDYMA